jgi:hypothetical protein
VTSTDAARSLNRPEARSEHEDGPDVRVGKEIAERTGLTLDQLAGFLEECRRDGIPGDTVLLGRVSAGRRVRELRVSHDRDQRQDQGRGTDTVPAGREPKETPVRAKQSRSASRVSAD